MSVRGKKLPGPATFLTILDEEARGALAEMRDVARASMSSEAPQRTHALVDGFQERVSRTQTGQQLVVQPQRGKQHDESGVTVAQVARWVGRGTGIYGPGGKRIRSKRRPPRRLVLPGGTRVWSVKGQRPNAFLNRVKDIVQVATPIAEGNAARRIDERLRRIVS